MRPLLSILLALGLALAGCTDGKAPDDDGTLSLKDVDVATTSTTGAIKGVVVDQAIRPVAGVNITLTPGGQNATSDDEGLFVVEGLDPGVYFLAAQALGYGPAQTSVDVVAGEASSVRFLLDALVVATPSHETTHYAGFMAAWASFASFVVEVFVPGAAGCTCAWTYQPMIDNLTTVVYEADGDAAAENPAPVYGTIYWEFIAEPDHEIHSSHGAFPVYQVFQTGDFPENTDAWLVRLTGSQWVHVNTQFDMYLTAWYHSVPPEGWSFVNGDV